MKAVLYFFISLFLLTFESLGQQNQKRNRGEAFYNTFNSNTVGTGDVWLHLRAVGHVWDDSPVSFDSIQKEDRKWVSNIRAFPEISLQWGLIDIASIHIDSRILSYGFRPGSLSGGLKLTTPNNIDLRLHGFGLDFSYVYAFSEANPTLGGYTGFMPEGFVVKGSSLEIKLLYELDILARYSKLPLRFLCNVGSRIPFRDDRADCVQFLLNTGLVYSGYGFDFYALYSLEAFKNFFSPLKITIPENKTIAVYFPENPMYIILGGNLRYDNGLVLSASFPLLVSKNAESSMRLQDLIELHRNTNSNLYKDEKSRGIKDPFDPWFVKWKIVISASYPLRYKSSSAELMRNFLLLKNRKQKKQINIDQKLKQKTETEDQERLDLERSIQKKKDDILNSH